MGIIRGGVVVVMLDDANKGPKFQHSTTGVGVTSTGDIHTCCLGDDRQDVEIRLSFEIACGVSVGFARVFTCEEKSHG